MRSLIAGNWKMNGSREETRLWLGEIRRLQGTSREAGQEPAADLLVCPPFPYLALAAELLAETGIALGAQDCHPSGPGAHTGDVAAAMLRDLGCRFVILGHSERRQNHGETDALIAAKLKAAATAGLSAILCVGESAAERQAGRAEKIVEKQLIESIPEGFTANRLVIAYEPVWAIGTGLVAQSADILTMHRHIRERLRDRFAGQAEAVPILYGGSVKPGNAREILALANVDGALVGGASLVPADFWAIASAARR